MNGATTKVRSRIANRKKSSRKRTVSARPPFFFVFAEPLAMPAAFAWGRGAVKRHRHPGGNRDPREQGAAPILAEVPAFAGMTTGDGDWHPAAAPLRAPQWTKT